MGCGTVVVWGGEQHVTRGPHDVPPLHLSSSPPTHTHWHDTMAAPYVVALLHSHLAPPPPPNPSGATRRLREPIGGLQCKPPVGISRM
jgi:hypothetical protein